jgi:GTPase SAR1 family protein
MQEEGAEDVVDDAAARAHAELRETALRQRDRRRRQLQLQQAKERTSACVQATDDSDSHTGDESLGDGGSEGAHTCEHVADDRINVRDGAVAKPATDDDDGGDVCATGVTLSQTPAALAPSDRCEPVRRSKVKMKRKQVAKGSTSAAPQPPPPPATTKAQASPAAPPAPRVVSHAPPVATPSLQSNHDDEAAHLDIFRQYQVAVLGGAKAGKTSMLKSLLNNRQTQPQAEDKRTLGIDIFACQPAPDDTWEWVKCTDSDTSDVNSGRANALRGSSPQATRRVTRLTFWDFAGQSIYQATHQCFLTSRALYLLVWDVNLWSKSDLDKNVFFWVYSIQSRCPGATIQIVATMVEDLSEEEFQVRQDALFNRFEELEEWHMQDLESEVDIRRERLAATRRQRRSYSIGGDHSGYGGGRPSGGRMGGRMRGSTDGARDGMDDDNNNLNNLDCDDDEDDPQLDQMLLLQNARPRVQADIVPVSALRHEGFSRLRQRIADLSRNDELFPHVGAKVRIPRSWARVAQCVSQLKAIVPYVKASVLAARVMAMATLPGESVASPSEADEDNLLACLDWLNGLGEVVLYPSTGLQAGQQVGTSPLEPRASISSSLSYCLHSHTLNSQHLVILSPAQMLGDLLLTELNCPVLSCPILSCMQ